MRHKTRLTALLGLFLALAFTSGCAAKAPLTAQAIPGRPAAAVVEELSLPYDNSKPRFALVVDSTSCDTQVAAQLTTTLSRVGNFILYDERRSKQIALTRGEGGPYIVRATVTEYNETAEEESERSGFSFGWLGFVAAIAGAVTGEPGLLWSGVGVAAANPGYHETTSRSIGMVGLDVQIIDHRSNRILSSFTASGRFVSAHEESSLHILGIGHSSERGASSALGQAQRIALNEVALKTLEALATKQP
jgi:curli biogenesis system outer membrane secretion channel CsgG